MDSELIEFFRFDDPDTGMLRKGDRYLRVRGNEQAKEVSAPINHTVFFRLLDRLRYREEIDENQRQDALAKLTAGVTKMLGSFEPPASPLQIDLVTNVAELSALPFELVADAKGRPVLVDSGVPLVLTRRVRRGSHGERPAWWAKPRVLFAVASPPGASDDPPPEEEHVAALRAALKPWIEPLAGYEYAVLDEGSVLQIVRDASPEAIRAAGKQAIRDGKPFTHLHILAHGCAMGSSFELAYGLAMHDHRDKTKMVKVTPKQLGQKLKQMAEHLVVVTLAACDAGNQANSIAGGGSMAHELHRSGIPVVVASQFPLTFDGSCGFTRTFYRDLLCGKDVREALYATRSALYRDYRGQGHDWASLVAYVQLPEDYDERLAVVRLQAELASLKTAQRWSDRLVNHGVRDPEAFEDVAERLNGRIAILEGFLDERSERGACRDRDENLGLLGSAQKRLAELYFNRAAFGDDSAEWTSRSRKALGEARDWYEESFTGNLSEHWTGIQSLALEAVCTGRISRAWQWHATKEAAEADDRHKPNVWAPGTLAELYLLAPLAGQGDQLEEARAQLRDLVRRADSDGGDRFPVDSTRRQLQRYVRWWTRDNGYFGDSPDLAAQARQLLTELPSDQPS